MNPSVLRALAGASVILTAVDDTDPAYQHIVDASIAIAREVGADLLFYDRSAESYLVDPYPYPEVLDDSAPIGPAGVRSLGRGYLAEHIESAASEAVHASAWLPRATGAPEMGRCVDMFHVDAVILPESLDRPSLYDRVSGNALRRFREVLGVPILLVTDEGEVIADTANAAA